jgi:uncharacterized membrane protein YfcA
MLEFAIGFASQLVFAIARTINVRHVAANNLAGSVVSGTTVAFLWVVCTMIGIDAYNKSISGLAGYLVGAAVGIVVAMRHKQIINFLFKR